MALPAPTVAFATPLATHPVAAREARTESGPRSPRVGEMTGLAHPAGKVGLREDARRLNLAMKKESRGLFGEAWDAE